MRHFTQTLFVFLFLLCFGQNGFGQSAGDIAFTAFNADGNDDFAFVTLVDIPANTTIWFTDNEWNGTDAFIDINEGEIQWSHSSIVAAGTVISILGNGGSAPTTSLGTVSGSGLNLGASDEELFALLTQPSTSSMLTPGFLAGIANDLISSIANTGLTVGTNFIDFNNDYDGFEYIGVRTGEAAFANYLPLIMNVANWQSEASDGTLILPIDLTVFSIGATPTVDWCNLQWPTSSTIRGGTNYNVYARVYESGVTDGAGQGAGITAWIGYNTADTDPSTWTNWVVATYNGDDVNNDEYVAEIGSALTGGTYYYASRFQLSGGAYSYGGYNAGGGNFWDGTTYDSQVLTVDDVVDWCNIQSPADGTVAVGTPAFNVYAQIFETDYTNPAGQAANIQSWIGYSTVDNDPVANPGDWTWVPASFNVQFGNNDEYVLDLGTNIGAVGTYYYVSRFQIGNGSYYYGGYSGTGGGFWSNTYTSGTGNQSGRLIISGPSITVTPTSLTGFTYQEGSGPSTQQSFTVEGSTLSDDITVTPPANWEIATVSGGPFQTTPITLTESGGSVALTTIYTRMVSGLTAAGSPYSGNIACTSTADALTENVAVSGTVSSAINAWINEIHYDNTGTDVGEIIEIVIDNVGLYTLANFRIDLYNGTGGVTYANAIGTSFTAGATSGTATIYTWAYPAGIQNGSPDGVALSYNGTLIQFLSYEGSLTATDGPAIGVTSTDIGVSETGSEVAGLSLQLSGTGCSYSDFTWQAAAANTMGAVNNSQTLCGGSSPTLSVVPATLTGLNYVVGNGPSAVQNFVLTGSNLTGSNVSIYPPTNYEISLSNTPFTANDPITLTSYDGSATTVYVRLAAGLAINTYVGDIGLSGGGDADGAVVGLSGAVTGPMPGAGDIAFVEFNADGDDNFAFVVLTDIEAGQEIHITDNGWLAAGGFTSTEGIITWTAPVGGVTCSTVIHIDNPYTAAPTANIGTVTKTGTFAFSGSGDQLIAYLDGDVMLAAVHTNGTAWDADATDSNTSAIPTGLTNNVNCFATGLNDTDDGKYTLDITDTQANILGSVNNSANWVYDETNVQNYTGTIINLECSSVNDFDSYASVPAGGQQAGGSISSLDDTNIEAVDVFIFDIHDLGTSDGLATMVTNIRIKPHSTNTADWTNSIQGLTLTGGSLITIGTPTITDTYIDIPITSGNLNVADAGTQAMTLAVYLNTSGIVDNSVLSFMIDADAHGFSSNSAGSIFAGTFAGDVVSNDFTITVTATALRFAQQPSDANASTCMSPDVAVEAIDANGNRDLNFTESIRITSTGTLAVSPLNVAAVSGLAVFTGASCVNHTVLGLGLTLNAERTTTTDWDVTSDPFNIIDQCIPDLIISEYIEGSVNNKYIEIYNGTGQGVDLSDYDLVRYSQGSGTVTDILDLGTSILANEAVFVVANENANAWSGTPDLSTANNMMTFNGDDVVALRKSTINIDIIGEIGFDPGSQWGTDPTSTANNTIIRKATVLGGDNDGSDAFDPSLEWDGYAEDYVADLGSHIANCVCVQPTINSTLMTFPNTTGTSIDVSWTMGNGAKRIVVVRQGLPVSWTPTDNLTYSANADFTLATDLGSGNKVVYNGAGNTFTLTGLNVGTLYYFEVYEYNCSAGSEDYLTTTPLEGNETTAIQNVTNFRLTCITNTTATLEWDEMTGNYDGILIAVRNAGVPIDPSCEGNLLNNPITDFSAADFYCVGNLTSKYVYNAKGTSVTITGLTPGQSYTFKAFTFVGSDWTTGTQTTKIANVQDVSAENTTPSNTQMLVYWINPTLCYDEIMVVAHAGAVVTVNGADGASVPANPIFGTPASQIGATGDYVVYKGVNTYVDVTALTNGVNYCFKIFVREGTEWSPGVVVCDIPADVTTFAPGEFVVIGFDSKVNGGSSDGVYLMNFVDIKSGTKFKWVNSRFEAGAPANVRTMHWGGSGDEPYDDPAYIELQWTGAAPLPAGSVISFATTGSTLTNTRIDGVATANLILSSFQGMANVSSTGGDQMWLVQGTFTAYGTVGVDRYNLLDGNILFGLTSLEAWVPISDPVSDADDGTGRESRVHPALDCFNVDLSIAASDYIYYRNGTGTTPGTPIHNGTKRNVLLGIMSASNWNSGIGTVNIDINEEFIASTIAPADPNTIGKRFSFTSGPSTGDGTWIGGATGYINDWFHCGNWEGLTVPDSTVNVTVLNVTDAPDINYTSIYAPIYDYTASCLNLTVDGETVGLNGSPGDTLRVYGDLTLQNAGVLNMDDGTGDQDGIVFVKGNWINNGTFNEGDGTVVLNGTTQQSITTADASGIETFARLTLNNTYSGGVLMNDDLLIVSDFIQNNNILDLNANSIELQGLYTNTGSYFIGDVSSDFTINGTGTLGNLYFTSDLNLNNFSINRTGQRAVLMSDLYMNNMTITAGGVTLSAANDYTVSGVLDNLVGSNGLLLRSNSESTASLLHSSLNVPAMCERYLTANNWHYVFSPLSAAPISQLTTTTFGVDNPNFYWYDETVIDFWEGSIVYNPTGWTAPAHTGNLLIDRGYIHQSPEDNTYTLSGGNLFAGDKVFTLSYTDNGVDVIEPTTGFEWDYFDGWNLIGNPYPSAVDWTAITLNPLHVENFVYYYDDLNDQYICYGIGLPWDNGITVNGGTKFIPANQGVFVKALPAGDAQTMTIPNSARVHNAQAFYKGSQDVIPNFLRLQIEKDGYADEMIVRTVSDATIDHDPMYDAYKMFAWSIDKPQLYSRNEANSNIYAVNTLPEVTDQTVVPLGVQIGVYGEYSIRMTENNFEGMHVWLEDALLEEEINLREQPVYTFPIAAELNSDRFFLHFGQNTAPTVNGMIPDQEIVTDQAYVYQAPVNLFSDADVTDHLTIIADLGKGKSLPAWLSFDAETMTFSGTPTEVETLTIVVTATDVFGAQASDSFVLNVKSAVSINEIVYAISIYPNPTYDKITVDTEGISNASINITDINGKEVINTKLLDAKTVIDLSTQAKGIYFIKIISDKGTYNQKMMVR